MSDVRERCVHLLFNFVTNSAKSTSSRLDAIRDELAAARADERAKVLAEVQEALRGVHGRVCPEEMVMFARLTASKP